MPTERASLKNHGSKLYTNFLQYYVDLYLVTFFLIAAICGVYGCLSLERRNMAPKISVCLLSATVKVISLLVLAIIIFKLLFTFTVNSNITHKAFIFFVEVQLQ